MSWFQEVFNLWANATCQSDLQEPINALLTYVFGEDDRTTTVDERDEAVAYWLTTFPPNRSARIGLVHLHLTNKYSSVQAGEDVRHWEWLYSRTTVGRGTQSYRPASLGYAGTPKRPIVERSLCSLLRETHIRFTPSQSQRPSVPNSRKPSSKSSLLVQIPFNSHERWPLDTSIQASSSSSRPLRGSSTTTLTLLLLEHGQGRTPSLPRA